MEAGEIADTEIVEFETFDEEEMKRMILRRQNALSKAEWDQIAKEEIMEKQKHNTLHSEQEVTFSKERADGLVNEGAKQLTEEELA